MLYTDNQVSIVTFSHKDIGKFIQNLNPNKTHGHDNISICMLINMWFTRTIYGPLGLIFKEALSIGLFPLNWKKGDIVPIYKKGDKQILKNYNPVSLLPICEKIFGRLISQELFNVLLENENDFISPNQFRFIPGDSCINQLLPIHTKFSIHLMRDLKSEESFWTFLKPLIKCGTKVFFLNRCKMIYLVTLRPPI